MNTSTTKYHTGPDYQKDKYIPVGGMTHERNQEIHPSNIWLETGLDQDHHMLWSVHITEALACSRLFNWVWSRNYDIVKQNVNEIVLKRTDPDRTCQTLVWRRLRYIHQ